MEKTAYPLPRPDRVRTFRIPFAWADPRLRDRMQELTVEEGHLFFFLHLAADRFGCSYWSDGALGRKLNLSEGSLIEAREGLIAKGRIAYRYPLYQILAVEETAP